jgi:hypothetical protein
MLRDLDAALGNQSTARPETPAEYWRSLLAAVAERTEALEYQSERIAELEAEAEELNRLAATGQQLVEAMARKMPEGATEDEDGWITSYRIPVGPWHRLLAWSRSFATGLGPEIAESLAESQSHSGREGVAS